MVSSIAKGSDSTTFDSALRQHGFTAKIAEVLASATLGMSGGPTNTLNI